MIKGGIVFRHNMDFDNHSVDPVIYQTNRKILERFAEIALYQHGCLSDKLIQRTLDAVEPEKSYTHVVYETDGKSRIMFANEGELNMLISILEKAVGKENMESMRRKISEEVDPITPIVEKVVSSWKHEWPLDK